MIPLDELPRSGQLIIAVHFKGYRHNYANDTRRTLLKFPAREDVKNIGIEFYPLDYWLKRMIIAGKAESQTEHSKERELWYSTRAGGGLYKFGFANMLGCFTLSISYDGLDITLS